MKIIFIIAVVGEGDEFIYIPCYIRNFLMKLQKISRNILTIQYLYAKIGIVKVIFIFFEK